MFPPKTDKHRDISNYRIASLLIKNNFRYMIEKLGYSPNDAIHEFNEARGHVQERENLIQHLK